MRSACASPGRCVLPSPITRPSLTITAPTIGLGLVCPRTRAASSIALSRCCASRSLTVEPATLTLESTIPVPSNVSEGVAAEQAEARASRRREPARRVLRQHQRPLGPPGPDRQWPAVARASGIAGPVDPHVGVHLLVDRKSVV